MERSVSAVNMRLAILYCLSLAVAVVSADQNEFDLQRDLRQNYNSNERPTANYSEPVVVKLKMFLQQIIDMDEKNQVIELNVWLEVTWNDHKLRWDQRTYGGVSDIRFPTDRIWVPDIILYNSADPEINNFYQSFVTASATGDMYWLPPGIVKSQCKIDITWFPFDTQLCMLKFGSWTYHGNHVDLQVNYADENDINSAIDRTDYMESAEWLLMSTPAQRIEKTFACCPDPYPYVLFYFEIRRRTWYYGYNLIIPSLLISLATVLGFTLPPDACEKITLEITILLAVFFFLSQISNMTPPTSEAVPLIGTFFSCCMMVVAASVVFTVVVMNLHFRTPDTHEMTPFARAVLLEWLPWLLLMRRPGAKFNLRDTLEAGRRRKRLQQAFLANVLLATGVCALPGVRRSVATAAGAVSDGEAAGQWRLSRSQSLRAASYDVSRRVRRRRTDKVGEKIHRLVGQDAGAADHAPTEWASWRVLLVQVQRIYARLVIITGRMEKDDQYEEEMNDWKFAAMVVDRLCLVLFSIFIVASTCSIMFSAPHLIA